LRKAIAISLIFHAALLTWLLGYFSSSSNDRPKQVASAPVPVDIMTPSQFTKIKAGEKKAPKKKTAAPAPKPKPKKIAKPKPKLKAKPKPKPVKKARVRPKPKPKPKAKPKVRPKPRPKPKKHARAKPKPKARPKPKPKARPKPRPGPRPQRRESEFDPDNIAALLNKIPEKKSAPAPNRRAAEPQRQAESRAKPTYGRSYGRDAAMSANEIDAFRAQISRCWSPPVGGLGSRDLNVKLRIRFKPDGTLEREPELANYSGSPFFRPAAEAAKRAVWQCQPYRMPRGKYETWRDMILNFDPREMMGG
jgi:outer membrane biosynthesis protein TonB